MKTKTLTYGGLDWLVLSETDKSVLVLAEHSIGEMPFDENNNNDWKNSSLRKYLKDDFLKQLEQNGADLSKIIPMQRNLTTDDGLTDYGFCEDKITLLTADEYRTHRYSIKNLDNWWWLATAYSTASNGYPHYARSVDTDGTLNHDSAYYGDGGVRPALTLSSEIFVSTPIENYTTEELLRELLRRETEYAYE